jgi:hypothetical protein
VKGIIGKITWYVCGVDIDSTTHNKDFKSKLNVFVF